MIGSSLIGHHRGLITLPTLSAWAWVGIIPAAASDAQDRGCMRKPPRSYCTENCILLGLPNLQYHFEHLSLPRATIAVEGVVETGP